MNRRTILLPLLSGIVLATACAADAGLFDFWRKKENPCPGGGAGGISPSVTWLDMSPITDIADNEPDLQNYRFDFSDNTFVMMGGMGYGGNRCGAKVGGGGWFGYKKFISDSRRVPQADSISLAKNHGDTAWTDSMAHLHTMLAYGGFLAEKNFPVGKATFTVGGLFGGGALILGKDLIARENNSAFASIDDQDSLATRGKWTAAPLTCLDVHAGVSYKLSTFMVVGLDANLLMMYSDSGFNLLTESFSMFNPGIRLRILFGNLG